MSGTLICKKCEEQQFAKDFSGICWICIKCLERQIAEFVKETSLEQQIAKNEFSGTMKLQKIHSLEQQIAKD